MYIAYNQTFLNKTVPTYSCTDIRHLHEQRVAFLFPMFIIKFRVGNAILLNTAGDSLACEALTTLDLLLTVVLNAPNNLLLKKKKPQYTYTDRFFIVDTDVSAK